jgi:hypothetical protein
LTASGSPSIVRTAVYDLYGNAISTIVHRAFHMNRRAFFARIATAGIATMSLPQIANARCWRRRRPLCICDCPGQASPRIVPAPPWDSFDNGIPFARFNRQYRTGSYIQGSWVLDNQDFNLDEEAFVRSWYAVTGGKRLLTNSNSPRLSIFRMLLQSVLTMQTFLETKERMKGGHAICTSFSCSPGRNCHGEALGKRCPLATP